MNKKILVFLLAVGFSVLIKAQNSIPNGNFEVWDSVIYQTPQYFINSSNSEIFSRSQSSSWNAVKSTNAHHGSFALELSTIVLGADTQPGYIVNGSTNNDPNLWTGGIPISETPTGFRGYYKYNLATGDSGLIILAFSASGTNIGTNYFLIGGNKGSYTLFDFPITGLSGTPDSVVIAFASTNKFEGGAAVGTILNVDSISFTGITTQPAMMNGSFENWVDSKIMSLDSWWLDYNNGLAGTNQRTTDSKKGMYALRLETTLGDRNGIPRANAGQVGTGYYDCSGGGPCSLKGGYPFANQVDTLVFSYKYFSVSNDSAVVNMSFKNNGSWIWNIDRTIISSSNYIEDQIPFNIGSAPDSVIILFQSSHWNDTLVSFVGSELYLDDIYFKSQKALGIGQNRIENNGIKFYPNPFKGSAKIEIDNNIKLNDAELIVTDLYGKIVERMKVKSNSINIDLGNRNSGLYFYQIKDNDKVIKSGKFVLN